MTIWTPVLDRSKPIYLAIADAITHDVEGGTLPTGTRLPPQRDLAWRLGVTLGTITRAYKEAEGRGLLAGEVIVQARLILQSGLGRDCPHRNTGKARRALKPCNVFRRLVLVRVQSERRQRLHRRGLSSSRPLGAETGRASGLPRQAFGRRLAKADTRRRGRYAQRVDPDDT